MPAGGADLGGEVGERREVVAGRGGLGGEAVPHQLHAVAGVPGEADDDAVAGSRRGRGVPSAASPGVVSPRGGGQVDGLAVGRRRRGVARRGHAARLVVGNPPRQGAGAPTPDGYPEGGVPDHRSAVRGTGQRGAGQSGRRRRRRAGPPASSRASTARMSCPRPGVALRGSSCGGVDEEVWSRGRRRRAAPTWRRTTPSSACLAPLRGDRWTWEDLRRIPEDGLRYEVLDGQLVVNASPRRPHQRLVLRLAEQLRGPGAPADLEVTPLLRRPPARGGQRRAETGCVVAVDQGRRRGGRRGRPRWSSSCCRPAPRRTDLGRKRERYASSASRRTGSSTSTSRGCSSCGCSPARRRTPRPGTTAPGPHRLSAPFDLEVRLR